MVFVKLSNIALIGSGQNAPQDINDYILNGETFIKVSNLDDILYDDNENKACKISMESVLKNKLKKFPKSSIIFAKSGLSCNKNRVYLTKEDSYIVNHLCVIFNISEIYNPKWLTYFIKFHNITKYIKDESYPSISLKDISNIKIPVIDISMQNEIVSEIQKIEQLIKFNQKGLIHLDNIVKSQFIEMFENDLKGNTVKLSDVTSVITKGTTPTTLGYEFVDEGINFVKIECLTEDYQFIKDKMLHITEECNEKLKRSKLQQDDILFSIAGAIGRTAIVSEDILPANTNQALAIIRLKESSKLNVNFLNEMLHSTLIEEQVNNKKTGVAQTNLSLADISNLNIIIPDIERQKEYANFVQQIDKSKFIVQKQIKLLEELLEKKMNEYFGQ